MISLLLVDRRRLQLFCLMRKWHETTDFRIFDRFLLLGLDDVPYR